MGWYPNREEGGRLSGQRMLDIIGDLFMHYQVNISDQNSIITEGLDPGVEFAIAIPSSTNRISSVDIQNIDSISQPYKWVESWQGYSLTQSDFDSLDSYNPETMYYNPSTRILSPDNHYELVLNDTEYIINFNENTTEISKLLYVNDGMIRSISISHTNLHLQIMR